MGRLYGWFREVVLTQEDIRVVQGRVCQRSLRWFATYGYLDKGDAKKMARWADGGCAAEENARHRQDMGCLALLSQPRRKRSVQTGSEIADDGAWTDLAHQCDGRFPGQQKDDRGSWRGGFVH